MRVHDTVHILLTWGLTVFDSEFFTYFYAGKWSSKWWNSTNWDKASTGKSWEEVMFCTFIVYSNVRSVLETLKFGSSWLMLIEITLTYDKQNWAVEYLTCTDTCGDFIRIFLFMTGPLQVDKVKQILCTVSSDWLLKQQRCLQGTATLLASSTREKSVGHN